MFQSYYAFVRRWRNNERLNKHGDNAIRYAALPIPAYRCYCLHTSAPRTTAPRHLPYLRCTTTFFLRQRPTVRLSPCAAFHAACFTRHLYYYYTARHHHLPAQQTGSCCGTRLPSPLLPLHLSPLVLRTRRRQHTY